MPPIGYDIDDNVIEDGTRGSPIYMDPFRSEKETPITDLEYQLNFLGVTAVERANFLAESHPSEVVLRCSKNILNSVQRMTRFPDMRLSPVEVVCAKYAAIWSSLLLSDLARPTDIRHNLLWLMELFASEFPSDIHLIEQYVAPLLHGTPEYEHILESLHVMRAADEIPKQVKRRSSQRRQVKYCVGQVFRHRRVEDKSVRYVAEENIEPMDPELSELSSSLVAVAGKHFKRWDEETRTFVSNIRDEYPED
ncbi:hypothetical protein AnigIFM59636_009998 [Aspergillus niger]|nr:hypothetical protein AnigIFM59636_009998 [Aspergillus niger]